MPYLIIGPDERQKIADAIARARTHPVTLEMLRAGAIEAKGTVTLEDRKKGAALIRPESEHVQLGTYRASLSFEEQPAGLYRHLSISTDKPGMTPPRPVVDEIAEAFGMNRAIDHASHVWLEEFAPGHFAVNLLLIDTEKPAGHA